jgi:hypothetical protein
MDGSGKKIKEMWWEGNDLHFLLENEEKLVLENAYYSSVEREYEGNAISVTPCSFVYEKVEL